MPEMMEGREDLEPAGFCSGCGDKILDRYYLLAVEKQWHVTCLVCSVCRLPLDSEVTCFAKDDDIYCKDDYYRRFVLKRCAHCQSSISSDELVMRVRDQIYHINCFTCAACGKQLTTGEHFGLSDNMIFCQLHYESLHQQDEFISFNRNSSVLNQSNAFNESGNVQSSSYFQRATSSGSLQKGRPRKRKNAMTDAEHFVPALGNEISSLAHHDEIMLQHPRQKRMRTSFKHHQLRIMKSYFALNHNPDSKDLKQLAQKTGLSKRVLQVWFQNARAKHRRTAMKERDKQQQENRSDKSSLDGQTSNSIGHKLNNSFHLNELSNSRSPALSDISSSPSLMGLRASSLDRELISGSGLTDIFSATLKNMN